MAQPPGYIVRAGPERILVPPGPGPAFPLNRLPVRRRRRSLALKSYGGRVGLAGRQPQQQRRRPLQNYVHDVDENVVTSTTPRSPSPTNADESREISLTEQVLSNHLIWNLIGRHLSISDLKICRLVSQLFNHHVLNSTNFKDRALVTLTSNFLRLEEFGTTQISWKHVSLRLHQVCTKSECVQSHLHDLSWVIPMLSEVESLILLAGSPCPLIIRAISPAPTLVIKATKKLKDLIIDEQILSCYALTKFPFQLSKLQTFKIDTNTKMSLSKPLYAIEKMLNVTKNLKVFKTSFKMDPNTSRNFLGWNVQMIFGLIQQNLPTMEIIKLPDPVFVLQDPFFESESILHMKFPLLTSLRIHVCDEDVENLITFIKAQPRLTQLTLDSFGTSHFVFPNLVLGAVAQISGRLTKLHVKANAFGNLSVREWKFLRNSKIQDLSIWPWKDRLYEEEAIKGAEFVPQVLKYLPPKVKRVRLQSGFVGSNANSLDCRAMPIYLGRIDPEVLTCLCLSRMAGFITDATLEYIFSNFLMLQELHLSDLEEKVTEFGFTGVSPQRPQQSDFSIENLKGLKRLTVRSCEAISDFSLLKAFRFQELRYLDLRWNPNINVQGCIAVAQQNPSLEVFMNDRMSGFPKEESVRRQNFPRLKFTQKSLVKPDIADHDD